METIEEYQEESTWDPLSITATVLNSMLKSSNPASIYELRSLMEGFGILEKEELVVLFSEIKYLQSIKASVTSDDISMLTRDAVVGYAR